MVSPCNETRFLVRPSIRVIRWRLWPTYMHIKHLDTVFFSIIAYKMSQRPEYGHIK